MISLFSGRIHILTENEGKAVHFFIIDDSSEEALLIEFWKGNVEPKLAIGGMKRLYGKIMMNSEDESIYLRYRLKIFSNSSSSIKKTDQKQMSLHDRSQSL